jgi:phosphotransferase system  glucose/maltose/N-acetylglucosamine-specific IIC component
MKFIELLLEIFGWLQIVVGVTIGGGLIAFVVFLLWSDDTGKTVAIVIAALGFVFGCIWATKIWKKYGTINWLSSIRRIS